MTDPRLVKENDRLLEGFGWLGPVPMGRTLDPEFGHLAFDTRGLQRFALGASGLAATSSSSPRYSRAWSALAVR